MTPSRALMLLCGVVVPLVLHAAPRVDDVSVTLTPDTSLRGLAERYLNDPDAWPEILRANQLASVEQLRPGMQLRVPVVAALDLERRLGELRQLIYQAIEAGAQVFATDEISAAIESRAAAVRARRSASLQDATSAADRGIQIARAALQQSREQRDQPAEAVLDDAGGQVERRRPAESDWTEIAIETLLQERERLRTSEESFAVVRFRDASTILMGESAQLAIRKLRRDQLTRREDVGVVLYGGDLRAMLGAGADRRHLRVETDDAEAEGRSRHFWIEKKDNRTRLSNFDGRLEVTAAGSTVRVEENQGTLIEPSKPPEEPRDLLTPPSLRAPSEGESLFELGARLSWTAVEGAASYWVEVARDRDMTDLVLTEPRLTDTDIELTLAEEGVYYWRVSSVDLVGLPGPASPPRHFQVARDATSPYLSVTTPKNREQRREPLLEVSGQTERWARLTINGAAVSVGRDGTYRSEVRLEPGANLLELEATDRAGNRQRVERVVYLASRDPLPLELQGDAPQDAQGRYLVTRPWLELSGTTAPQSLAQLRRLTDQTVVVSGIADERGHFTLTVPAATPRTSLELFARGLTGQERREPVEILLDRSPPVIRLDKRPPERVADRRLVLSGRVEDARTLRLRNRAVPIDSDGRFSIEVELEPGDNHLALHARDDAGNQALWQQRVLLDQEPPDLDGYELTAERAGDQSVLSIEIRAGDASGLVATAPYRVEAGGHVHEGVARRCADHACYRDRLAVPTAEIPRPRLSRVILQDYLGNRREVDLDR